MEVTRSGSPGGDNALCDVIEATSAAGGDDCDGTDWVALRSYLRRRCRLPSAHDRDDCVQEALCVLCERLRTADPPQSRRRFAFSVLRHREADLRRLQLRESRILGDVPDTSALQDPRRRNLVLALLSDSSVGLTSRETDAILSTFRASTPDAAARLAGMDPSQYGRSLVRAVKKLRIAAMESLLEVSTPNDSIGGHTLISAHESRREFA